MTLWGRWIRLRSNSQNNSTSKLIRYYYYYLQEHNNNGIREANSRHSALYYCYYYCSELSCSICGIRSNSGSGKSSSLRRSVCCFNSSSSISNLNNQNRYYHSSSVNNSRLGETTTKRTFSTTSTSNSSNNTATSAVDYSTNDGLVVGVWVFCRHGDRTPSRSLCPLHRVNDEAAYWMETLPTPDTMTAFLELSQYFPLELHNPMATNNGEFLDVHRNPFGFLTSKGMQQMKQNGELFYKRYNIHGYHRKRHRSSLDEPDLFLNPIHRSSSSAISATTSMNNFLIDWDVEAYSTNYLRTVLSVQSFLDGLLGTNIYDPTKQARKQQQQQPDNNTTTQQSSSQQQSSTSNTMTTTSSSLNPSFSNRDGFCAAIEPHNQERLVPNHQHVLQSSEAKKTSSNSSSIVPVHIRDQTKDNLNAFDRNPDLMAQLVSDVMTAGEFVRYDSQAAPLAARLANILPGLGRKGRNDFSRKTPSGINWVEAADHFVCRNSHDLPLTMFTDFERDDRVELTLSAISYQTLTHLAWRFRQWYKHPPLLAAIALPALREILDSMNQIPHLSAYDKHPFVLYSCHDVTLLALLYALGAEFLKDDDRNSEWRYWPNYASTLVVELVQISPDNDKHVIRILLNGEPIRSIELFSSTTNHYLGNGPKHMLLMDDFRNLVDDLEDRGQYDFQSWNV